MSQQLFSLAFGVGTQNRQNNWLEVFYAQPLLQPSAELLAAIAARTTIGAATRNPHGADIASETTATSGTQRAAGTV